MKNLNNQHSNFWFGFTLGMASIAAITYLLGTKQGRQNLKKLLEHAENLEELSPGFFSEIQTLLLKQPDTSSSTNFQNSSETQPIPADNNHTLNNLIDKIKHITQPTINGKKFFEKGK